MKNSFRLFTNSKVDRWNSSSIMNRWDEAEKKREFDGNQKRYDGIGNWTISRENEIIEMIGKIVNNSKYRISY